MGTAWFMQGTTANAKTTIVWVKELSDQPEVNRIYEATGNNALYNQAAVLKASRQVASGSTLQSYRSDLGQGYLYASQLEKLSNGSFYMMIKTFDTAYAGWIYVGKNDPLNISNIVIGGLKHVTTTAASPVTAEESTHVYTFKQVGTANDGTMLTYTAPQWTQYGLDQASANPANAKMADSTPYKGDKLQITKAVTRNREGDRWVYVHDEAHPEIDGWILDSALVMLGQTTVKYQDQAGGSLHADDVLTGAIGDNYSTPKLEIPGYQFIKMGDDSASPEGQFGANPLTVTYLYAQIAGQVTVYYVDEAGTKIDTSQTISGNVGDSYQTEQRTISGYTYESVDGDTSGKLSDKATTVTYHYKKNPVVAGNVTANYVDENGNKIATSRVIKGNVGDDYKTDKLTIPGYTYESVDGDTTGKLGDKPVTVTYHYKKNATANPAGNITVNYVDENGKHIAVSKVLTGKLGETYQTDKLAISGYTYVSVDGTTAGQFGTKTATVTYHYKKDVTDTPSDKPADTPTEPSNPTTKPDDSKTDSIQPGKGIAFKGQAIYAIRKVGLYRNAEFSKHSRVKYYNKAKRINRPEFVVKGYKRDQTGHLRYRVQQYDPYVKRYIKGTTGYLTASAKYVIPAYYATKPKSNIIRVINPKGAYEYQDYALAGKRGHHIKVGTTLKVNQIRKYKYTTRYRLTNGKYVTGNKKFVISVNK